MTPTSADRYRCVRTVRWAMSRVPNPRLRHMLIGYARVSKADGRQSPDLQRDALTAAGVDARQIYSDRASGKRKMNAPGRSLPEGAARRRCPRRLETRPAGRSVHHRPAMHSDRSIGLKVLSPARVPRSTRQPLPAVCPSASLPRLPIRRRACPRADHGWAQAARARERKGGRTLSLTKAQVRTVQAAMAHRDTSVPELCRELGITPVTLYRYVDPQGNLRDHGK